MARVIIHSTMTLDGFMARPNDEIDWAIKYADDEMSKGIMAEIGRRGSLAQSSSMALSPFWICKQG